MIDSIRFEDFEASACCKTQLYTSIEAFYKISCTLRQGEVYGIFSDFGCGSWAAATSFGGRVKEYSGDIFINDKLSGVLDLQKHSCFLPEADFSEISDKSLTVKEYISSALKISGSSYMLNEIKNAFALTDARFDRTIDRVSGEIWYISSAINFALGKDIYIFPWMSTQNVHRILAFDKLGIFNFLRKEGKIIIIPSAHKRLFRRICDKSIDFGGYEYSLLDSK